MCVLTQTHRRERGADAAAGGMALLSISQCHPAPRWVTDRVFFPCYFVSQRQHWLWWLIDWAGAAGFKTTTLAAAAQGNTERAGRVNARRENTTLVICQPWESYNKLGITICIVLKWKMRAEPGRSILNTLSCASAWGPRAKALFPSCWAVPHTPHQHTGSQKPFLSLGKRGSLPACPHRQNLLLFTYIEM